MTKFPSEKRKSSATSKAKTQQSSAARTMAVFAHLKRCQTPLETYVFPLILLLWPLYAVNQGVSLMDTTYSLANYTYPDGMGHMWLFATYLANVVGEVLVRLPAGHTLLGMNIMTALFVSATALVSYYILKRMIAGWMVFLGEFLAEALCWCPTVILYNYLTYFLLTLGTLFLFLGVSAVPGKKAGGPRPAAPGRRKAAGKSTAAGSDKAQSVSGRTSARESGIPGTDSRRKSHIPGSRWFVLAGICLGLNVTVKVSNVEYAALILAVWFWCAVTRQKAGGWLRRTAYCILGFAIGFLVPVLCSMAVYGPTAYFSMIPELLGATGSVGSYTAGGMLGAVLSAYGHSLRWFLILIPCTLVGAVWFALPMLRKARIFQWAVYLAGIILVLKFFYSRGMFTTNYQDYWSMFEWGMLFLILAWIGLVLAMIEPSFLESGGGADERFLAAAVLIQLLILPLGSNNYTFPILNCLFVIAPFTIWMLRRLWQETRHVRAHFSWHVMALMILIMTLWQGSLFHMNFAFRDGTDGAKRSVQLTAQQNEVAAGMYTTPENAQTITALTAFLAQEKQVKEGTGDELTAITFGNIPGVHYLCQLEPAVNTTWVDLDSYPTASFAAAMETLSDAGNERPLVVIYHEDAAQSSSSAEKYAILEQYMQENAYQSIFQEGKIEVFR